MKWIPDPHRDPLKLMGNKFYAQKSYLSRLIHNINDNIPDELLQLDWAYVSC